MKDVHLHGFHAVEIALKYVHGNEVAADVDHKAAPCEARLVLDGDCGSGEAVGRYFDELKKSLQSAKNAKRIRGVELCASRSDFEGVRFILTEFLDFFAGVIGVHDQKGSRGVASGLGEKLAALALQLSYKTLSGTIESGLCVACEGDGEIGVDS